MLNARPLLVGLTGSIGMGKTTTAQMFESEGIPVFHADLAVHQLYASGGAAVKAIARAFPGCASEANGVDRAALSAHLAGSPAALATLEKIVHPLVAEEERRFVAEAERTGAEIIVLDIPLLFETAGDKRLDAVVVVSAPEEVQRARVLSRPGMSEEKLVQLMARQMPDAEKRAQAHFVVETDKGLDHASAQVREIVAALRARREG